MIGPRCLARPSTPRLAGALVAVLAALVSACSASPDVVAAPDPTPTPAVEAGATEVPTAVPSPTPTPLPVVADVVADTTFGAARLTVRAGLPPDEVEVRALVLGPATIEVSFSLDEFLAVAALGDQQLAADPLATQAAETLASPWTVRSIGAQVYVQQDELAVAAGGAAGEWVLVTDPATLDVLASGGLLAGGLNHPVLVEVVRSAADLAAPADDDGLIGPPLDGVRAYDTVLDGSRLSSRGRSPAETAALLGLAGLESVDTPARIWVDADGALVQVRLDVPPDALADGTPATSFTVSYRDAPDATIVIPDALVASAG